MYQVEGLLNKMFKSSPASSSSSLSAPLRLVGRKMK